MELNSIFIYFFSKLIGMIRERKILPQVRSHIFHKQYTIITGARQVGKTSLMRLLFQELSDAEEVVYFMNLEDRRILDALNSHPGNILNFLTNTPKPILTHTQKKPVFLLLDEVQYLNDPTNFLKYLYDTYEGNLKIIATGSSAFYMDRKFRDSLAGRKRIFPLYPLSFEEFISFKDEESLLHEFTALRSQNNYHSLHLERLRAFLMEYLLYGGYPAVVLEKRRLKRRLY